MDFVVAKYLRISNEDIGAHGIVKKESNSIASQRAVLDEFISKTPDFASCRAIEIIEMIT